MTPYHYKIEGIAHGKPLETLEQCLSEMELALVTVRDVIARNADGAPFENSYIGVNLGLYVAHMDGIIRRCREILNQPPLVSHNQRFSRFNDWPHD